MKNFIWKLVGFIIPILTYFGIYLGYAGAINILAFYTWVFIFFEIIVFLLSLGVALKSSTDVVDSMLEDETSDPKTILEFAQRKHHLDEPVAMAAFILIVLSILSLVWVGYFWIAAGVTIGETMGQSGLYIFHERSQDIAEEYKKRTQSI